MIPENEAAMNRMAGLTAQFEGVPETQAEAVNVLRGGIASMENDVSSKIDL